MLSSLVLAATAWLSYRTEQNLRASEDWVSHTEDVITALESGMVVMTEAEASQRGFLLTGDEKFAQDSDEASNEVIVWLESVRTLTADNPEQQKRIEELTRLATHRLELLKQRMEVRRQQGFQAAVDAVATREGKETMDKIRVLVSNMREMERTLLADRKAAARANAEGTAIFVFVASAITCLGGLVAVMIIRRDLGRRQQAELALQENRALLQSILDNTSAVVVLKDLEGRYLFVNRRFAELAKRAPSEVTGRTVFELFPKPLAEAADAHDRAVRTGGRAMEFEETVQHPDGPHTHLAIKFPLLDSAGKIYATGMVSTDISARKRAEEERDRFFNLSRDLMCIAGFDGYFKALNPQWEITLGFTREELLAKPFLELMHPEDRAASQAEVEKLATGQETLHFENRFRTRDGGYRWIGWSARPALAQGLIYATGRDVTEQKASKDEIARLNDDLRGRAEEMEKANHELEAFSYSVSHDLRAPLRHIDGFVRLLARKEEGKLSEQSRHYMDVIAGSARQMGELIDDLLVFSRMGRMGMKPEKVAMDSLAKEIIRSLGAESGGRKIEWTISRLPEATGDLSMLRQVWVNLLSNAVKYTQPREVARIEVGCQDRNGGERVYFVRDNGVGFDMRYVDKLFGVFQRLHSAEEFEGTGIGLANVNRIVQRHGGRVWAEGKVEAGASFYFSLPAASETAASL